jgi:hypothetical protein
MTLTERTQYDNYRNLIAVSAARKLEREADTATVVNILKISRHYFVTASTGGAQLDTVDAVKCDSREQAVIVASQMAIDLGTNAIIEKVS